MGRRLRATAHQKEFARHRTCSKSSRARTSCTANRVAVSYPPFRAVLLGYEREVLVAFVPCRPSIVRVNALPDYLTIDRDARRLLRLGQFQFRQLRSAYR